MEAITVGAEALTEGAESEAPEYLVYYSLCVLEESVERQHIEDSIFTHYIECSIMYINTTTR